MQLLDARGLAVARARRRFGIRPVRANGSQVHLDAAPIFPRGLLDWGWADTRPAPAPSRREVDAGMALAASLRFHRIKHCRHMPPETALDAADEHGLLLWLELPMWPPPVDSPLEAQTRLEGRVSNRRGTRLTHWCSHDTW